ncbi:MAG: HAMP domain-containing histidine kinase [Lachnospiraceae bacterium]|nr:HAMP domain-containing histidine kinase [Ruminococcus sp.]MCM1275523.1 HAMP domain-containing histidine kinase [Lachnospiraceae bacterium]
MKKGFLVGIIVIFFVEISALVMFASRENSGSRDVLAVNEALHSVREDWGALDGHINDTGLDYAVLGNDGELLYRTREGVSENIAAAIAHRDAILDIEIDGEVVGKLIASGGESPANSEKRALLAVFAAALILQAALCAAYALYLEFRVVKPFGKMKGFAERVAGGNLDIPLEMDRGNLFGAFTESFDIMRSELKKARVAEAKANASKKELVAKLSHDIRTPVASIKAVAELGAAVASDEKTRENYEHIILKADQINTLVKNLFSAALEDLQQLTVTPADLPSTELAEMLRNADYLNRAEIPEIPERLLFADKLRLQQVFDNIFANSYKYADTDVIIEVSAENGFLTVSVEDFGGGAGADELPSLKEKFKRGKNTESIDGAGLGLFISDTFMREMGGELKLENGERGLKASVIISLSKSEI